MLIFTSEYDSLCNSPDSTCKILLIFSPLYTLQTFVFNTPTKTIFELDIDTDKIVTVILMVSSSIQTS